MATVIYDADCGFCRWSLALLLTLDRPRGRRSRGERGALRPLPLGTPEADRLLADLSVEEREASWHLVEDAPAAASSLAPSATLSPAERAPFAAPLRVSAGAALAPALALLAGGRIPASLVACFPRVTERGYRWVADHRGLLGRLVPARARRWADRVIAAHAGPRPQ